MTALAVFVAYVASTNSGGVSIDGYERDRTTIALQLALATLTIVTSIVTCHFAARRAAGLGPALTGAAVSMLLAAVWFFVLLVQNSN